MFIYSIQKNALTPKLEMDSVLIVIMERLKAFSQATIHSTKKKKLLHERNKNMETNNDKSQFHTI